MDCEHPQASKTEMRIAKKNHICCECRGTIHDRERYMYFSGVWDSVPNDFKTCQECLMVQRAIKEETSDEIPFGYLREYISEMGENHHKLWFNQVLKLRKSESKPLDLDDCLSKEERSIIHNDFVEELLYKLEKNGIDMTGCDSEDDPIESIAQFIAVKSKHGN